MHVISESRTGTGSAPEFVGRCTKSARERETSWGPFTTRAHFSKQRGSMAEVEEDPHSSTVKKESEEEEEEDPDTILGFSLVQERARKGRKLKSSETIDTQLESPAPSVDTNPAQQRVTNQAKKPIETISDPSVAIGIPPVEIGSTQSIETNLATQTSVHELRQTRGTQPDMPLDIISTPSVDTNLVEQRIRPITSTSGLVNQDRVYQSLHMTQPVLCAILRLQAKLGTLLFDSSYSINEAEKPVSFDFEDTMTDLFPKALTCKELNPQPLKCARSSHQADPVQILKLHLLRYI
ncbi:hypothetical protein RHMOL_Rhmol11G0127700 [Rhododendron molle]|uniref:Uncharacterized protein n=1 Tax=Rhododendron molle TaxID=49168 RepID=A0ACC0LSQ4_RHOML|nr:hypothetical protein RHMOL_Rhmol11G0127700 [Rhododendron molle]